MIIHIGDHSSFTRGMDEYARKNWPLDFEFHDLSVPPPPREDEDLGQDALPKEWKQEFEHELPMYLKMAIHHAERGAQSYRHFNVGCVVLARNESDDPAVRAVGNFLVPVGANIKERPGQQVGEDKLCAERTALNQTIVEGSTPVVGLVIASNELQPDEMSGVCSPTLHPCEECRKMFKQLMEIGMLRPDTQIVSVKYKVEIKNDARHCSQEAIERHTLKQLLELHENARENKEQ